MALYNSIQELIGHTPLVKLGPSNEGSKATIYAKLEQFNPSGSVKDRVGKYMIRDAEEKGLLKPGYTIIEATAGNTGLGIAFAALGKGYRIIFVVPTKFSIEKQQLMMALGAEIISTPREKGMLGAEEKAEELLKTIPNSISLRTRLSKLDIGSDRFEAMAKRATRNGKVGHYIPLGVEEIVAILTIALSGSDR